MIERQLKEVAWEITDGCNLNCIHCYNPRKRHDLSLDKIFDILSQLKGLYVEKIKYGGGEPLLRKDFTSILRETIASKISTTFSTNGYLITESLVDKIKDTGLQKVQLSIDGNKHIHDYVRQNNKSYEKAVNAIRLFKNAGFDVSIATTLLKPNLDCLGDIHELCTDMHVKRWRVMKYVPVSNIELMPNVQEYLRAQDWLKSRMNDSSIDIFVEREFDEITECKDSHDFQCFGGRTVMSIKANGDVTPCSYFPNLVIGNLEDKTIKELWDDPMMRGFQDQDFGDKLCKYYKDCSGGCKAAAYYTEKHLNNKIICDPYCWIKEKYQIDMDIQQLV